MEQIPFTHILIVSSALFFIGIYGFFARRNLVTILMSLELILNSASINFIAINRYLHPDKPEGIFFTLFVIVIAAAEVSLTLAIIINLYRRFKAIDIEDTKTMKY